MNGSAPQVPAERPENTAEPDVNDRESLQIPRDPGAEGMSPSQRRAYDRGFRDCSAGRYEPDRYSEAYRIGCAAAQHD